MEGVSLFEILIWVTLSVQILPLATHNIRAIQNKNIKTNISHPLQRKNITLIFLSFLKKKYILLNMGTVMIVW
jgi:hypothetical protein